MITVDIVNEQTALEIDDDRIQCAVASVFERAQRPDAHVTVAIVDDPTIHDLNRRFLDHDWPTDVLSFLLDDDGSLDGELVVSTETAIRQGSEFGLAPADELLLYVIHGALHLVGYDDASEEDRKMMRRMEAEHLAHFGIVPVRDATIREPTDREVAR